MLVFLEPAGEHKPLIGVTMFGVTTPAANEARETLTGLGYEVLVFHATGTGGRAMEKLVESGLLAGVCDLTTTELADGLTWNGADSAPVRGSTRRITPLGSRPAPEPSGQSTAHPSPGSRRRRSC